MSAFVGVWHSGTSAWTRTR